MQRLPERSVNFTVHSYFSTDVSSPTTMVYYATSIASSSATVVAHTIVVEAVVAMWYSGCSRLVQLP